MNKISKTDKMKLLLKIRSKEVTHCDFADPVAFDLFSDDQIKIYQNGEVSITPFGLYELDRWDPILCVFVNDQLVSPSRGDA